MNNNIDREYISLELVKLAINNNQNDFDVYSRYSFYLKELYKIEDLENIPILKAKLDDLTNENKKLREYTSNMVKECVNEKFKAIEDVLNNNKGNMELHVYNELMNIIK